MTTLILDSKIRSLKKIREYFVKNKGYLALYVHILDEERKLTYIFMFTLFCGTSKGFMKAFRPFEAPQRSVKIKIKLTFILIRLSEMHRERRVKEYQFAITFLLCMTINSS